MINLRAEDREVVLGVPHGGCLAGFRNGEAYGFQFPKSTPCPLSFSSSASFVGITTPQLLCIRKSKQNLGTPGRRPRAVLQATSFEGGLNSRVLEKPTASMNKFKWDI